MTKKLLQFTYYDTGKELSLSPNLTITKVIEHSKTLDFAKRTAIQCADGGIYLVKEPAKTVRKLFGIQPFAVGRLLKTITITLFRRYTLSEREKYLKELYNAIKNCDWPEASEIEKRFKTWPLLLEACAEASYEHYDWEARSSTSLALCEKKLRAAIEAATK